MSERQIILSDEERYAIVSAESVNALVGRVNATIHEFQGRVVGGPLWLPSGHAAQAVMLKVPKGWLIDSATRCNNDRCDIRSQCLRYREAQDPWLSERLHSFYGGKECDARIMRAEE